MSSASSSLSKNKNNTKWLPVELARGSPTSDGIVGSVPRLRGKHYADHACHLSGYLNIYGRVASDAVTRDTQLFVAVERPFYKLTYSETERKVCFLRYPTLPLPLALPR